MRGALAIINASFMFTLSKVYYSRDARTCVINLNLVITP